MKRTSSATELKKMKKNMVDNMHPQIPEGELLEQFWKRVKEKMAKTPLQFVKSETMKERKYENALHYIMGVLSAGENLTPHQIDELQAFIKTVLEENEEPQKQVIRG